MNLNVCWSRDVIPTHGCLTSVLDDNKTAQKYHCMEMVIAHLCCQHCFNQSTVLYVLYVYCVYVLSICDISCLQYSQVRHVGTFRLYTFRNLLLNVWHSGRNCNLYWEI